MGAPLNSVGRSGKGERLKESSLVMCMQPQGCPCLLVTSHLDCHVDGACLFFETVPASSTHQDHAFKGRINAIMNYYIQVRNNFLLLTSK